MKVALYIRVSSAEQKDEGLSLEVQEKNLSKYAQQQGWEIAGIYKDEGRSGKDIKGRSEFQRLFQDAKKGKFKVILVTKLDRAFRSTKDALNTLDFWHELGIDLVSLAEKIDTTNAQGKLFFTLISAFSQFERDLTSDRVKEIQRDKVDKGLFPGKAPFGYKSIIRKKKIIGFSIDVKRAEIVKGCFEKTAQGIGYKQICLEYGLKPQIYYNILKNKSYIGIINFEGKEIKSEAYKPLITDELFYKCQK